MVAEALKEKFNSSWWWTGSDNHLIYRNNRFLTKKEAEKSCRLERQNSFCWRIWLQGYEVCSMILVDTSVLINFFRGRETPGTKYLETLISKQQPFCINEFIYQELLQGSKDEKEFSTLKSYLSEIPLYSLKLGIQSYENAASLNFRCRRKGFTIRSTIDLLIAETAIENNIPLLHDDEDFVNMAHVITELKLAI